MDTALLDWEGRIGTIVLSAAQLRNVRLMFLMLEHTPDALAKDEIAVTLLREISDDRFEQRNSSSSTKAVNEVRGFLAAHPGEEVTLSQIGRHVQLSPYHLARLFQKVTGTSIHRYRLQIRLAIAFNRLRAGWTNIASLAADLGFAHHSHFSESFRKMYGLAPSTLRNAARVISIVPREIRIPSAKQHQDRGAHRSIESLWE